MQSQNEDNYQRSYADAGSETVPTANQLPQKQIHSDYKHEYDPSTSLQWQASEYVQHEKQGLWFAGLYGIAAILLVLSVFIIQSITFAVLIVVMAVVLAVYAVRQPKIVSYNVTPYGVEINKKRFMYSDFRYFGIIKDNALYSIQLIPNKRFMPIVTMYFPEENGEQIVDMLGSFLPMKHVELDFIDKISRRLHF